MVTAGDDGSTSTGPMVDVIGVFLTGMVSTGSVDGPSDVAVNFGNAVEGDSVETVSGKGTVRPGGVVMETGATDVLS